MTYNDYTDPQGARRGPPVPRDELSLDYPPRGIRMEHAPDGGTIIRVRLLSAAAFPMLVFALFWNSITSIFVAIAIAQTAARFGYDIGFSSGKWEGSPPPLWFFWLFLTPFIAIGLGTLSMALFSIFGRCEIRLGAGEGSVFKGIGPLGRTQHFSTQSVKSVDMGEASYRVNNQSVYHLVIEMNNGREIKLPRLGKMRETWLTFALQKLLNRPTS